MSFPSSRPGDLAGKYLPLILISVVYAAVAINLWLARAFDFHRLSGWLLCAGLAAGYALCLHPNSDGAKVNDRSCLANCIAQLLVIFGLYQLPIAKGPLWLLVMPPVSLASFCFGWPLVVAFGAAFLAVILFYADRAAVSMGTFLAELSGYGSAILFAIGFTRVARSAVHAQTEARALATQLEEANARLRAAAARTASHAALGERNRIARDIHDGLGHYLTTVAVQLEAARKLLPEDGPRAAEAIAKAENLAREALAEVRRSVASLRSQGPSAPLGEALESLLGESGLSFSFQVLGAVRTLPDDAELTLFRVAQEGLTNVRKHAQATRVELSLDFQAPNQVSLRLTDDGRGPDGQGAGFGLRGLRERLEALGGSLEAGPRNERGFCLLARLPA